MLPGKFLKTMHAVMAILELFEQFSNKFCLKIFDPNSDCPAKYDAFCSHIFDHACLSRRPKAYCYRRGSNFEIMEKLCTSKTF